MANCVGKGEVDEVPANSSQECDKPSPYFGTIHRTMENRCSVRLMFDQKTGRRSNPKTACLASSMTIAFVSPPSSSDSELSFPFGKYFETPLQSLHHNQSCSIILMKSLKYYASCQCSAASEYYMDMYSLIPLRWDTQAVAMGILCCASS